MKDFIIKKEWSKPSRIILLILILLIFVIVDIVVFKLSGEGYTLSFFLTIIIDFIGLGYFVITDIKNIYLQSLRKIYFDNDGVDKDFSFVDREDIINDINKDVKSFINNKRIKKFNASITYIEPEKGNGKSSLCKKIANMLYTNKKIKTVNVFEDVNNVEDLNFFFNSTIFVKNRVNILIINMRNDLLEIIRNIRDKDIFFICFVPSNNKGKRLNFSSKDVENLIKSHLNTNNLTETDIKDEANRIISLSDNISEILLILKNGGTIYFKKNLLPFYKFIDNMEYKNAMKYFEDNIRKDMNNSISKYKAQFEYANINHFLGEYKKTIEDLEFINTQLSENDQYQLTLLKDSYKLLAHTYKHIGNFEIAKHNLECKYHLFENDLSYIKSYFSILIFFYNDKFLQTEIDDSKLKEIKEDMGKKFQLFKKRREEINDTYYYYETYYAIYHYYKNDYDLKSLNESLKYIDLAINYYEKNCKRLVTNCYFIKAEIYRHLSEWDKAIEYYLKCCKIYEKNQDNDIRFLLSIIFKAIEVVYDKKVNNIPDFLDFESCKNECCRDENKYPFHLKLFYFLDFYQKDKVTYNFVENFFKTVIIPIP